MLVQYIYRPCVSCGAPVKTTEIRLSTGHGRFCNRACYLNRSDATATARFWAKVNKDGPIHPYRPELGQCWLWTGTTDDEGYGRFEPRPKKPIRAHRYGYTIQVGPIPDDASICHSCDRPPCIRGTHVFPGTPADNSRDMALKGRGAHGDRHSSKTHPDCVPRGERHAKAKLTEVAVLEIRALAAKGERTQPEIAQAYNVSVSLIGAVVQRRMWTHI